MYFPEHIAKFLINTYFEEYLPIGFWVLKRFLEKTFWPFLMDGVQLPQG